MINDAMVDRMARWLDEHDERERQMIRVASSRATWEQLRSEAMHALQCALQESIGPAVTIRTSAQ